MANSSTSGEDDDSSLTSIDAPPTPSSSIGFDLSDRDAILAFLRYAKSHPEILEEDLETRTEMMAASKALKKNKRRKLAQATKDHDMELINKTENVRRKKLKATATKAAVPLLLGASEKTPEEIAADALPSQPAERLLRPRRCYVCKEFFDLVHHFYEKLCPTCAKFNFEKRFQTADLTGKIALVTGARVKIGYEIALKLLRAGCRVIATSRFPRDTAQRFAQEPDFDLFKDQLDIYGLDLLFVPVVERFCAFLATKYSHLDILINNAAMTLSRPSHFFEHLQPLESAPLTALPSQVAEILTRTEPFFGSKCADSLSAASMLLLSSGPTSNLISNSAGLHDEILTFDGDGQVIDQSTVNSWKFQMEDVPTADLAQLINAIAPFVLVSKLKPLLEKSPSTCRFIINVSAMEGSFSRSNKTSRHPHTNCAKASLNMMTRTAAQHYAKSCIYMNSVDTGWCSEMLPLPSASAVRAHTGEDSRIPLDEIDGAARVLDPIFSGIKEGVFVFGKFLKDFREASW